MLSFFNVTSKAEFDANAREQYQMYYSNVRAAAKAHGWTMLEYRMGDGWEPLREFLGHDVPDVGFPKTNEEVAILGLWDEVERRMWVRFAVAVGRFILPLLLLAMVGFIYIKLL